MIKRAGVEVMNARTRNVSLAKETLEVLKKKQYVSPSGSLVSIRDDLDAAVSGTILYDKDLSDKEYVEILSPTIEVVNETTAHAGLRLYLAGYTDVVALNFASARNVGGGFLAGAIAQEEDLCRASGLYVCTKSKPMFYNHNILADNSLYTDDIIYSPNVPFFRDENNNFLERTFQLSIITTPAPNLSSLNRDKLEPLVEEVLQRRAIKILKVAAQHNHKTIILGAWGCGAFGNDPKMVSKAFQLALQKVPAFEHICFAVYDNREPKVLFDTFQKILG